MLVNMGAGQCRRCFKSRLIHRTVANRSSKRQFRSIPPEVMSSSQALGCILY